jgi:hypothetical protein
MEERFVVLDVGTLFDDAPWGLCDFSRWTAQKLFNMEADWKNPARDGE